MTLWKLELCHFLWNNNELFVFEASLEYVNDTVFLDSVVGSVIQATEMVEFEDGFLIGNHLKAQNSMQRVQAIPKILTGVVCTPDSFGSRLNSNGLRCYLVSSQVLELIYSVPADKKQNPQ